MLSGNQVIFLIDNQLIMKVCKDDLAATWYIPYSDHLSTLGLSSLQYHHLRGNMIHIYRMIYSNIGLELLDFFSTNTAATWYIPYSDHLSTLGLSSLQYHHLRGNMIHIYRMIYSNIGLELLDFFSTNTSTYYQGSHMQAFQTTCNKPP